MLLRAEVSEKWKYLNFLPEADDQSGNQQSGGATAWFLLGGVAGRGPCAESHGARGRPEVTSIPVPNPDASSPLSRAFSFEVRLLLPLRPLSIGV